MIPPIYKLTADGSSGVTITELAEACYDLSKRLAIPVDFIHNDRHYTVSLEVKESTSYK